MKYRKAEEVVVTVKGVKCTLADGKRGDFTSEMVEGSRVPSSFRREKGSLRAEYQ